MFCSVLLTDKSMKTVGGYSMLAAIVVILSGCMHSEDPAPVQEYARPAKIFQVQDGGQAEYRSFPAEVEANGNSLLAFRVGGQIAEVLVKGGEDVTEGDLLARLDPADFLLEVEDKTSRYTLAESQFERAKKLAEKNLVARSDYDVAAAMLGVARAALSVAKANYEYTFLRAPFSGIIAKVAIETFENVSARQSVLLLQTRDQVDISVQIPENVISRVKEGTGYQPTVIFDTHPHESYVASIKEWDSQPDASTRTYKVVFTMRSPEKFRVLPGMSATLRIDMTMVTEVDSERYMLPIGAVIPSVGTPLASENRSIWKVDSTTGRVHLAEVTVGEIRRDSIEVLSGVEAGDEIVAVGAHYLEEGMRVSPWNREAGL
jgi:RND family efflux transporter MFP subunit